MATSERARELLQILEGLWANFDELFAAIDRDARWSEPYGRQWLLRDVPYHMMYFDRETLAEPLERGTSVPVKEQRTLQSARELNAWNDRMFTLRPPGETSRQSISRWRAVRERIRKRVGDLDEKHLDDAVWVLLPGLGWLTARNAIEASIAHTWGELVRLVDASGVSDIEPAAAATHAALAFRMQMLSAGIDEAAAGDAQLTVVLRFGPLGGDWTLRVVGGQSLVEAGAAADADLVIAQSPLTAELVRAGVLTRAEAVQRGDVQVTGAAGLEAFERLFPTPGLDTAVPPANPGAKD